MELITGRTGIQHVKAIDDAEMYKVYMGDGDYVLETGGKLNAEMSGTTACKIYNGTAVMQGRQCKIRQADAYETVTIDAGTAGYKRWDIICIEYDIADGIESAELVVVKGSTSADWSEPTVQYADGDIDAGEKHRMKLWGVKLDGINFDSLVDYRNVVRNTRMFPDYTTKVEQAAISLIVSDPETEAAYTIKNDGICRLLLSEGGNYDTVLTKVGELSIGVDTSDIYVVSNGSSGSYATTKEIIDKVKYFPVKAGTVITLKRTGARSVSAFIKVY